MVQHVMLEERQPRIVGVAVAAEEEVLVCGIVEGIANALRKSPERCAVQPTARISLP